MFVKAKIVEINLLIICSTFLAKELGVSYVRSVS